MNSYHIDNGTQVRICVGSQYLQSTRCDVPGNSNFGWNKVLSTVFGPIMWKTSGPQIDS